MDHADVKAWLADAFFSAGLLRGLEDERADDPELSELRQHLAGCEECSAELAALRTTAVGLDLALGPSPAARERVLSRVAMLGRERKQTGGWRAWRSLSPVRAAGAVALVGVLAFTLGLGLGKISAGDQQPSRLANVIGQLTERLADADARQAYLQDQSGARSGMVVISPAALRLAVLSSGVDPVAADGYACYLERDGELVEIGPMNFEGDVGFWAGPLSGPPDPGRAGDRFLVLGDETDRVPVLWTEF
jgi:hypothetical protein